MMDVGARERKAFVKRFALLPIPATALAAALQ
jgi:hypothetical protein